MLKACLLLMMVPAGLSAALSLPKVDLSDAASGTAGVSLAIWSATSVSLSAGAKFEIHLPAGTSVPAKAISTCECIGMKWSVTNPAGAAKDFMDHEFPVTSGAVDSANRKLTLFLPYPIDIGKFYIRFRGSFGLINPYKTGMQTLMLVDPDGVSVTSKGYYISLTSTPDIKLTALAGTVFQSGGTQAASGALITASTDPGTSGMHPMDEVTPVVPVGPRTDLMKHPRSVTSNAYTAASASDGSYSLLLPAGTYQIRAWAARVTTVAGAAVAQSATSATISDLVVDTSAVTQNITLGNWQ